MTAVIAADGKEMIASLLMEQNHIIGGDFCRKADVAQKACRKLDIVEIVQPAEFFDVLRYMACRCDLNLHRAK